MVPAHVGAVADGAVHRFQVAQVEVDAARVPYHAVRVRAVAVRAAVLGDLQDRVVEVPGEPDQHVVERLGPDLPAEIRLGPFAAAEGQGGSGTQVGVLGRVFDQRARVEVHAHEVQRSAHLRQVAFPYVHGLQRCTTFAEDVGVGAAQGGADEHLVHEAMPASGRGRVGVAVARRLAVREAEGGADAQIPAHRLHGAERQAVGAIHRMHRAQEVGQAATARCVDSHQVPARGEDVGLVEDHPVRDPVAQGSCHPLRVVGEAARQVALGPAAGVLQGLGQVPVVERREGPDARVE